MKKNNHLKKYFQYLLGTTAFIFFFIQGFCLSHPTTTTPFAIVNNLNLSSESAYFEDDTPSSGIEIGYSPTVVFGDYDNDGWTDVIVGWKLFKNISSTQQIRFTEVTSKVGIDKIHGNPLFADFNNDGLLDIVTSGGHLWIQKNSGQFVESSKDYNLQFPKEVQTIAVVDVNKDGFLDILVGRHEIKEAPLYLEPQLFINVRGKLFINNNPLVFKSIPNYLRSIAVADYNNDGSVEAYFSNYRIRPNNFFNLNSIWMRDLAPQFKIEGLYNPKKYLDPTTKQWYGPRYGHTIASTWGDLNNDGNFDLWVSNLVHKFVGVNKGAFDQRGYLCDDSKIYRNTGAPLYQFVDMRASSNIPYRPIGDFTKYNGDELWAHTTMGDFDNDGWLDVYVSQVYDLPYSYSLLYKNNGNFKFTDVGAQHGIRVFDSYAAAWADINNDGKLDLIQAGRIKNGADRRVRVLKNVMPDGNNYLKIRLTGKKSGSYPVTAQVRVFHPNGVFLRQVDGAVGTMNQQNDPTLHFGLGKVTQLTKIEITWPSGKKQVLKNIKPNQLLKVVEPL